MVRPLTIDEGGGDVRDAMKKCKLCNDYLALARDHAVYCDEPGEPCNVNSLPDPEPPMEANKPHFYDWLFSDRSRLYFLSGLLYKEHTEVDQCLCSQFNISLSAGVFFNGCKSFCNSMFSSFFEVTRNMSFALCFSVLFLTLTVSPTFTSSAGRVSPGQNAWQSLL